MNSDELLLLRTTWVDDKLPAVLARLADASGMPVAALVDNRGKPALTPASDLVPLNDADFADLGLYCPPNVGWRCGDYGMYVARKQFPQVKRFWLIEEDLGIDGDARGFFDFFHGHLNIDFLAPRYDRAERLWYWWTHAAARNAIPQKCGFGILRLSDRALDQLYKKRRNHSRMWSRKSAWPNDEVFVATTIANGDLTGADFNSFGRSFYSMESYRLGGEPQDRHGDTGPARIVHPVRIDRTPPRNAHMAATDRYTRRESWLYRKTIAVARRINRFRQW